VLTDHQSLLDCHVNKTSLSRSLSPLSLLISDYVPLLPLRLSFQSSFPPTPSVAAALSLSLTSLSSQRAVPFALPPRWGASIQGNPHARALSLLSFAFPSIQYYLGNLRMPDIGRLILKGDRRGLRR